MNIPVARFECFLQGQELGEAPVMLSTRESVRGLCVSACEGAVHNVAKVNCQEEGWQ